MRAVFYLLLSILRSNWTEGIEEHGCSQLEKDQAGNVKAWEFHFLMIDHNFLLIPK